MKVLILGGSGMLGHKLYQTFAPRFDTQVSLRHPPAAYARFGILDESHILGGVSVEEFGTMANAFATVRPEVAVNCIGIVKQDVSAKDSVASITVNALFPHRLARLCAESGTRLIHISTDCVFSGRKGNYGEDDTPDAEDLYGRTKLLGEVTGANCLTIRTSMIGRELAGAQGLVEWFLSQAGSRVRGFRRAVFSGFTTAALAALIADIIAEHRDIEGLYHVAAEPITKFDLLSLIKEVYGLQIEIDPDETFACDRSLNGARVSRGHEFCAAGVAGDDRGDAARPDPLRRSTKASETEVTKDSMLTGKNIVVTGGTGSLGKVLVRRLLSGEMGLPKQITVFSRDEAKQHTMRLAYEHRRVATDEIIYHNFDRLLQFQIGDVRDPHSVAAVLRRADVVFNAAALKQVPSCEYFPFEAVQTNIIGAENIIRVVRENRLPVETVVGISTDKACKPVNVMGMTKAVQERLFVRANLDSNGTRFICVRYGNVLASRGSVIPLFHEQIRRGGPVTITTTDMTRFLLSLEQAVDTIFAAVREARRGETYIPRVPSARVTDLAAALLEGRAIEIKMTGIRPGEKVHEILVSEEEAYRTIERGDYYVIQAMLPELRSGRIDRRQSGKEYRAPPTT